MGDLKRKQNFVYAMMDTDSQEPLVICNFKLCVINSLAIIEGLNYL